jgi:hypothetical protein
MYVLNHFPNAKHNFSIRLNDTGKFWQLMDNQGGIIAEANSWRSLKKFAEYKRLPVQMYR